MSLPEVAASDANIASAVGAGTPTVGSVPITSLAASGAGTLSVCVGAGDTNIALFPPRSGALAAAIETTIKMAVLTVRPVGTQGGSLNAVGGDSSGASAASHSEENGRGPAGRPERTAMRPGIKRAPDAQLTQEKLSG